MDISVDTNKPSNLHVKGAKIMATAVKICGENRRVLCDLGRGPLTHPRVNRKKSLPKVVLKPKQATESIDIFEDEEDQSVPMDIEMDDILEEAVVDIDVSDARNPLAVVEYVADIYANYRKMETYGMVSPNYMLTQQTDINGKMRAMLIDWLIKVHYQCHFQDEALYLTVNIIDRFLAKQSVSRKKLQLVGMVAMWLACKYEQVNSVPDVGDLIYISAKAYTRSEVLQMENLMLHTLEFKLSLPTPYVFLKRYLKAAQADSKLHQMSFFLMELCLVEYETIKFTPSLLAAASVYTAQCSLSGFKHWSKTCESHAKYSEDQLQECSRMIVRYHQRAATGRFTAVYMKYNTSDFDYAANCEPAMFIVEETQQ